MDYLEKKTGITHLDGFAYRMHEIYGAFVNAGFSPDQAMELLLNLSKKD